MDSYPVGTKVQIKKPGLREHGANGTVQFYDPETEWHWVELDSGPPWRGKYERGELTPNREGNAPRDAA